MPRFRYELVEGIGAFISRTRFETEAEAVLLLGRLAEREGWTVELHRGYLGTGLTGFHLAFTGEEPLLGIKAIVRRWDGDEEE